MKIIADIIDLDQRGSHAYGPRVRDVNLVRDKRTNGCPCILVVDGGLTAIEEIGNETSDSRGWRPDRGGNTLCLWRSRATTHGRQYALRHAYDAWLKVGRDDKRVYA